VGRERSARFPERRRRSNPGLVVRARFLKQWSGPT
jgi:hypothetical protein